MWKKLIKLFREPKKAHVVSRAREYTEAVQTLLRSPRQTCTVYGLHAPIILVPSLFTLPPRFVLLQLLYFSILFFFLCGRKTTFSRLGAPSNLPRVKRSMNFPTRKAFFFCWVLKFSTTDWRGERGDKFEILRNSKGNKHVTIRCLHTPLPLTIWLGTFHSKKQT